MAEDRHQKEQPIIIKKVKKGAPHGHHGGAWKVAYADFVTAMMAFFIVMWILGSSDEVKQAVSDYFNHPFEYSILTGERKTGSVPVDLNFADPSTKGNNDGSSKHIIKFDKETADTLFNRILQKAATDSSEAAKRVSQVRDVISNMIQNLKNSKPEMQQVIDNIKIEMSKEGLRIELVESTDNCFFEIGSARLSKQAEEILIILAEEIGKLPNYVELEGHTDARAYKSNGAYTNWDLSTDRANSARKILQSYGFWDGQLNKVTGYADQKLKTPDNPFDNSNRRVSILVKHIAINQFLPKE
ncbi:MAG: flagellar motor protein MotB [Candidatus Kapabacteria bacterium]|jgi:chemotaxis protein MotB|nr:flagellar motor protein MotB [Candidatus Kapabacteria bacterium]